MKSGRYAIVVIAASAGGVQALQKLLSALPHDFPLPIAVVQHRSSQAPNLLARVLGRHSALTVKLAEPGETISAGTVYLAPPHRHLVVRPGGTFALVDGHKVRHVLSSANPLFASAAEVFPGGVIAVVLTGGDSDATDGVQSVTQSGGMVIAQDEASSTVFGMPRAAIASGAVHAVLPLAEIARELRRLAKLPKSSTVDSTFLRKETQWNGQATS
jgi:two-component system chemotaxis response regulator CheB